MVRYLMSENNNNVNAPGKVSFEIEWRRRFQRFAQSYKEDHLISGWSDHGLRRRLALFETLVGSGILGEGSRVLDLGCGAGTYVRYLASCGHRATGLDYSLPSLHAAIAADSNQAGVYCAGEAYHLPFRSNCFDLVVTIGVLQALMKPETVFGEAARILNPGGFFVVEFLNSCEITRLARYAFDRIFLVANGVRSYRLSQVAAWLDESSLTLRRRDPVFLPPRSLPKLAEVLDHPVVSKLLHVLPGVSSLGAHAYIVLAQKCRKPDLCTQEQLNRNKFLSPEGVERE